MPAADIPYRILARSGASIAVGQFSRIQEFAVIENSLRPESSAVALAADMRLRRRSPSEIARTASRAVFVAATAVLFVAWVASSH